MLFFTCPRPDSHLFEALCFFLIVLIGYDTFFQILSQNSGQMPQ